jgi:3-methyl-2-oxobutanoate hydroxymethyltransferase
MGKTEQIEHSRPESLNDYTSMKERGEKIVVLTAYDFLMARILEECRIDMILVGDSAGMVFSGHANTLPVTVDEMIYHARAVGRGATETPIVVDMPFLSYQVAIPDAIRNCGRVLKETSAMAVKLEGGEEIVSTVQALLAASIPVMGHIGLTPQSIHKFGGYRLRGRAPDQREKLIRDAHLLEDAGCFSIVLEMIPSDLASKISGDLRIPTIGIGAGPSCDGQVLVLPDLLGLNEGFRPRFLKTYASLAEETRGAVRRYIEEVRTGVYPSAEQSYDSR